MQKQVEELMTQLQKEIREKEQVNLELEQEREISQQYRSEL